MDLILKDGDKINEKFYRDITSITTDFIESPIGKIRTISNNTLFKDKIEHFGVMWGYKRNNYMIKPGIYALGNPKPSSPVLVTCNYKLTFDILRRDLKGMDCWILVLETNGVNVWCASGKGTFGTEELISRIKKTKLETLVSHKVLIIPQLGASGVSIGKLKKETGFRGIFGPIRSEDINEFISNKFKASEAMRQVKFNFKDRIKLTPLNLVQNFKYYFWGLAILIIINIIGSINTGLQSTILYSSFIQSIPLFWGVITAAMVFPLTLPIIPFKSFALKGATLGIIFMAIIFNLKGYFLLSGTINFIGYSLMTSALITNICLNFTGSTTYTSFSGVVKETVRALPLCIAGGVIGVAIMVISLI
jgi:hypothetical protein